MAADVPAPDARVLDQIVKAYDVRGVVGDQLDAGVMRAIGTGVARVLAEPGGQLLLGRDMRRSSPELAAALTDAVRAEGVDVLDLGLASTDLVTYASGELGLPSAMITASHNPAGYNGLKLSRAGAVPVSIETGLAEIRAIAATELGRGPAVGRGRFAPTHGSVRPLDLLERFAAHVRGFIDTSALSAVSVAVDAGNGMAGLVWPAVVRGTLVRTTPLFFELDGRFPNHPANPLDPANLRDLQAEVRRGGHALGLAFDGDADRVFAVDETGAVVPSSLVGAVVAERLLRRHPGATVLYNLVCSRTVPETIVAAGGRAVRTRVGHSFIKQRMAETDAVYAVEHSGHHYFRDNHRADSGVIAALVLLEAVAEAGKPLSAVVAPYDRYLGSGERDVAVTDVDAALGRVRGRFAATAGIDDEDGLLVQTDDGWFSLRPSNTEPVLRLNVEAGTRARVDALVAEVTATARAEPSAGHDVC